MIRAFLHGSFSEKKVAGTLLAACGVHVDSTFSGSTVNIESNAESSRMMGLD